MAGMWPLRTAGYSMPSAIVDIRSGINNVIWVMLLILISFSF